MSCTPAVGGGVDNNYFLQYNNKMESSERTKYIVHETKTPKAIKRRIGKYTEGPKFFS